MRWQHLLPAWLCRHSADAPPVPPALWQATRAHYPFLQQLNATEDARLQQLVALFLQRKEFTGTHGLVITDAMAMAIAAQACVLLVHWGAPAQALRWYDDFVGIVLHPGDVVAHRQTMDEAGVVHHYDEVIQGEAMEGGPVMLSWQAVQGLHTQPEGHGAADDKESGDVQTPNVVIHEFAHKIDMRNGEADGCPPLPPGFMGTTSARAARQWWLQHWEAAYQQFREQVIIAERFSGARPWLDPYGAEHPSEFFAVACEAFFVNRPRFAQEFPTLAPLLTALFAMPGN